MYAELMRARVRVPALFLIILALFGVPAAAQETTGPASFRVFLQGRLLGNEEAVVSSDDTGWTITGSNRLGPPVDVTTRTLRVSYDAKWRPREFNVDAVVRNAPLSIVTTFSGGTAASEITQAGAVSRKQDPVAESTIVLPNLFFASYEALALQIEAVPVGSQVRVYVVPQSEIVVKHTGKSSRKIETAKRVIDVRTHSLTFMNPGGPLDAVLWTDEAGRLLKFEVPAQNLTVLREDIAAVSTRSVAVSRQGDQSVRIRGNGFVLAGTLSEPSGPAPPGGRYPAIVLVSGANPTDRDEIVAGIPLFGQIAGALADAGFYVLRYDKRGIGQSGGRLESASLQDLADDARAAVRYLRERKDVDRERIALFGYSDGAWVALVAASRDDDIKALILASAAASTGGELVLEQQKHLIEKMKLSPEEAQARFDLQKRIQAAVLGDGSWDGISEPLRRQADTPWFRSYLAFSPEQVVEDVEQPVLILHGEIDKQVPANHADRLEELLKLQGDMPDELVRLEVLDGANHLLVQAETGELDEYPKLEGKSVDPAATEAVVEWLKEIWAPKK